MYQEALGNDVLFSEQTGVNKSDYDQLLFHFKLNCPQNLGQKEKLFAILHAKHYQLSAAGIGKLLGYSNASRDGKKFLKAGDLSLAEAVSKVVMGNFPQNVKQHIQPVPAIDVNTSHKKLLKELILENSVFQPQSESCAASANMASIPRANIAPSVDNIRRKKTFFSHNIAMSIGHDININEVLEPNLIVEHAQRRIDLFFYMLIAYYNTKLSLKVDDTVVQHGKGTEVMPACHSAILPSVSDGEFASASHNHLTRFNPGIVKNKSCILKGTHFENSLNSTILLHQSVNYFDTHMIEGKRSQDKMRNKSIDVLNKVSAGELDPISGMLQFLTHLRSTFDSIKEKYLNKKDLKTSPKQTRGLIFNCEEKGSFNQTWHADKKMTHRSMNDDYVHAILGLTPKELELIQKNPEETLEDYSVRFFRDREALYQEKYRSIAKEIQTSRGNLFARTFGAVSP